MFQHIFRSLRATVDLFVPPACLHCGAHLTEPDRLQLCSTCLAGIAPLPRGHCRCCAQIFTNSETTHLCGNCLRSPPNFTRVYANSLYEGTLRDALHRLKYRKKVSLARPLGLMLSNELSAQLDDFSPDLIIPVPLHTQRLKQRNFNQAREISRALSRELAIPVNSTRLVRHRHTAPQQGLSADARKNNLCNAFSVTAPFNGLKVLLVDDVMTTGETVRACSRVLVAAGAMEVRVAVVCRA